MSLFDSIFPWRNLARQHEVILMKLSELDETMLAQTERLEAAKLEITAKIGELTSTIVDLQNSLADVELPEEAVVALAAHVEKVREVEDIVT